MKKVNRIVSPILAAMSFAVLYFFPMFRIFISSSYITNTDGTAKNLLASFGLKEFLSFNDIVKMVTNGNDTTKQFMESIWKTVVGEEGKVGDIITSINFLYVSGAFLVLLLVFLLAGMIIAIFTKKPKFVFGMNVGALGSVLLMNVFFNQFAKPFLSGQINITSFVSAGLSGNDSAVSGLLSTLLSNVANVDYMQLSSAFVFTVMLVVCMIILSCCAMVMGDD